MSGILSPFGRSGVLTDVRGLTIRAYCRITSDNPSSSAFDRSYNVASISHDSTTITVNFIESIITPYSITNFYRLSTGNLIRFSPTETTTGLQNSLNMAYRVMNNNGSIATSDDNLNGLCVAIYGGIGS